MDHINFSVEYSELSDDELLRVASEHSSLTSDAAAALDEELRRRNLTKSDLTKHQQFTKQRERREKIRRRRKIFGTRTGRSTWVDGFWILLAIALISCAYLALPSRYHMKPDWEAPATLAMVTSVSIAVFGRSSWRKMAFWFSWVLSSAVHIFLVHAWIRRVGRLSEWIWRTSIPLGFVLFLAIYGLVWLLRRNLASEEAIDRV